VLHKVHQLLVPGGRVVLTQPNPDPYQVTVTSSGEVLHTEMVLEPNFARVVETTLRSYRRAEAKGLFRITTFPGMDGEAGVYKAYDYPSLDVWMEETSTFSIDKPVLEEVAGKIAEIVRDRPHTVTNRYKEDLIIMEKR
jgi:hypothetical protein